MWEQDRCKWTDTVILTYEPQQICATSRTFAATQPPETAQSTLSRTATVRDNQRSPDTMSIMGIQRSILSARPRSCFRQKSHLSSLILNVFPACKYASKFAIASAPSG